MRQKRSRKTIELQSNRATVQISIITLLTELSKVFCGDNLALMDIHEATAVMLVDTSGTIRYWSAGAAALFGHEAPVGETLDVIVPPNYRKGHWAGFHRAIKTGVPPIFGESNIPVLCKDGEVRSFPGSFTVVWDGHRRAIGAVGVFSERRGDETPFSPIAVAS